MAFTNTSDTLGIQETLDALVANELTELNEDGTTYLGQYALYHKTALTSVNFPNVVTTSNQNNYALQGCTGLVNATFDKLTTIANYMFDGCAALKNVSFAAATNIGQHAFQDCLALTNFDFSSITTLNSYCFKGTGLTDATLNKVTSIPTYAFTDCILLGKVDLVQTATKPTISANAFNGSGLSHLIIRYTGGTATLSNVSAFENTPIKAGFGAIYVPSDLVSTYKSASNWSTFAEQIYAIDDYPVSFEETITDSWETIFAKEDSGTHTSVYSQGDTKMLKIGNVNCMMEVLKVDEDKITWGTKYIIGLAKMNSTGTTDGGWPNTIMRALLNGPVYDNIESPVKDRILTVSKTYKQTSPTSGTYTSNDKVWLLSGKEVMGGSSYETSGDDYTSYFTNANARIKSRYNGSANYWWLRSAYSATSFYNVYNGGSVNDSGASGSNGVVFGFCT